MLSKNPPAALFLSTLSLRRATTRPVKITDCHLYFYPRSPCGERRGCLLMFCRLTLFLSTLSLRRATAQVGNRGQCAGISIHALLAESDIYSCSCVGRNRHFYPRSPCGERLDARLANLAQAVFLSTLSLRRATVSMPPWCDPSEVSIHALLAESDLCHHISKNAAIGFLSTLSLRRATKQGRHYIGCKIFLSTLSLRRATSPAI